MSWPTVTLGDIAESVNYGVTASASLMEVGPKFLRITDIQDNSVSWENVPWCECSERELDGARLAVGDIVFARTGATTGKSFLLRECPEKAVFASYLIRVRCGSEVAPEYLIQFFNTPDYWAQVSSSARGAAQAGVNASVLKSLKIPLPPRAMQQRISSVLEAVEGIMELRKSSILKLELLKSSIFSDMFGVEAARLGGWPIVPLGQLLESATYGTSGKSGSKGALPILRMGNLTSSGEIDLSDLKYIDLADNELLRYTVLPGDVLFNRTNSVELVGKSALYRGCEIMAYAGYLIRLRVDKKNDAEFLSALLNSGYMKSVFRGICKSIVGMANINAKELQAIKVAQPPLALQQEFSRRIERIEEIKATYRTHLSKLQALYASLQHRAFRGEL